MSLGTRPTWADATRVSLATTRLGSRGASVRAEAVYPAGPEGEAAGTGEPTHLGEAADLRDTTRAGPATEPRQSSLLVALQRLEEVRMDEIGRRRFLAGSISLAGAAVLAGCSDSEGDGGSATTSASNSSTTTSPPSGGSPASVLPAPGSDGLVDEAAYQARIDRYLTGATADLDPSNPTSIATHLIASHRDADFTWEPGSVGVEAMKDAWEQIDTWKDTRDFRLMYMHWVLALADGETPMRTIDPAVIEAIEQRLVDNRYQWDDPLPTDRIDNQWFWSENHLIIGLVNEQLAGQRMPDRKFTITGLTGAEHVERTKQPILDWVHERARFGFFEWHSHVYMKKNLEPLLTLVEFSEDPDLVLAGAMALDLCLLDMAGHNHRGTYTASRGRTYAKDKTSPRESTFNVFKLLFDDTNMDHGEGADAGASHFAGCTRYRPPQVLIDIATADEPGLVRERHGIFVDGSAPVTDDPEAPFGYDFDDPENLSFWWSQGAIGLWQLAEINLEQSEKFRILETEMMAPIKALVALNEGDPERVRQWTHANHAVVNFGHLREANTYCWRGNDVALATVVDHRFGEMRDQIHTWQATIEPGALIFTTHPAKDLLEGEDWTGDDKPGYWTGEASVPRSAQHERTGIHIYQPAWDSSTDDLLWSVFGYQDYTHAFVPQDRFDEVVRDGNWTFVRRGDGYIALWSWREPEWRVYDPAKHPMVEMEKPYDLVAKGGPDNVWIVEVGDPTVADSFADFMSAVKSSDPNVVRGPDGFSVAWSSPTSGDVEFGSTAPFKVAGSEQTIGEYPRHESRWAKIESLDTVFELQSDGAKLALDFEKRTRTIELA